jgi:hypothetical protein
VTIWILIGPDGKPYKGTSWRGRTSGFVKAFDNQRSANISAGQFRGVTVKQVEVAE